MLLLYISIDRSDLYHVLRVIGQFNDWRSLGSLLGLRYQTLQQIQHNNPPGENQQRACQIEMVNYWLDGEDDVIQYGGPTLQQLTDCLNVSISIHIDLYAVLMYALQ